MKYTECCTEYKSGFVSCFSPSTAKILDIRFKFYYCATEPCVTVGGS